MPLAEEKLLFIRSYMKNNPHQGYHAGPFGVTQPQCNLDTSPVRYLAQDLENLGKTPSVGKYLLEQCNNVLLDGTQRTIECPQDERETYHCLIA